RARTNYRVVAYAIGRHPDAQLASIHHGSEKREDKIDQVVSRLVERTNMRAMLDTSKNTRKRFRLIGAAHRILTWVTFTQRRTFSNWCDDRGVAFLGLSDVLAILRADRSGRDGTRCAVGSPCSEAYADCGVRESFLFTNSRMPSGPVSRPYPDFLIPP